MLFENRKEMLFYWLGAALFVAGSLLDILKGPGAGDDNG